MFHCITCGADGIPFLQYRLSLSEPEKQTDGPTSATVEVGSSSVSPDGEVAQKKQQDQQTAKGPQMQREPLHDPIMYPGLYSPSGFDMMGILVSGSESPSQSRSKIQIVGTASSQFCLFRACSYPS